MYKVRVLVNFRDKEDNDKLRRIGDIFTIESEERLNDLLKNNKYGYQFVEIISASEVIKEAAKTVNSKKKGK